MLESPSTLSEKNIETIIQDRLSFDDRKALFS